MNQLPTNFCATLFWRLQLKILIILLYISFLLQEKNEFYESSHDQCCPQEDIMENVQNL